MTSSQISYASEIDEILSEMLQFKITKPKMEEFADTLLQQDEEWLESLKEQLLKKIENCNDEEKKMNLLYAFYRYILRIDSPQKWENYFSKLIQVLSNGLADDKNRERVVKVIRGLATKQIFSKETTNNWCNIFGNISLRNTEDKIKDKDEKKKIKKENQGIKLENSERNIIDLEQNKYEQQQTYTSTEQSDAFSLRHMVFPQMCLFIQRLFKTFLSNNLSPEDRTNLFVVMSTAFYLIHLISEDITDVDHHSALALSCVFLAGKVEFYFVKADRLRIVANRLTSEYFGSDSILDENFQIFNYERELLMLINFDANSVKNPMKYMKHLFLDNPKEIPAAVARKAMNNFADDCFLSTEKGIARGFSYEFYHKNYEIVAWAFLLSTVCVEYEELKAKRFFKKLRKIEQFKKVLSNPALKEIVEKIPSTSLQPNSIKPQTQNDITQNPSFNPQEKTSNEVDISLIPKSIHPTQCLQLITHYFQRPIRKKDSDTGLNTLLSTSSPNTPYTTNSASSAGMAGSEGLENDNEDNLSVSSAGSREGKGEKSPEKAPRSSPLMIEKGFIKSTPKFFDDLHLEEGEIEESEVLDDLRIFLNNNKREKNNEKEDYSCGPIVEIVSPPKLTVPLSPPPNLFTRLVVPLPKQSPICAPSPKKPPPPPPPPELEAPLPPKPQEKPMKSTQSHVSPPVRVSYGFDGNKNQPHVQYYMNSQENKDQEMLPQRGSGVDRSREQIAYQRSEPIIPIIRRDRSGSRKRADSREQFLQQTGRNTALQGVRKRDDSRNRQRSEMLKRKQLQSNSCKENSRKRRRSESRGRASQPTVPLKSANLQGDRKRDDSRNRQRSRSRGRASQPTVPLKSANLQVDRKRDDSRNRQRSESRERAIKEAARLRSKLQQQSERPKENGGRIKPKTDSQEISKLTVTNQLERKKQEKESKKVESVSKKEEKAVEDQIIKWRKVEDPSVIEQKGNEMDRKKDNKKLVEVKSVELEVKSTGEKESIVTESKKIESESIKKIDDEGKKESISKKPKPGNSSNVPSLKSEEKIDIDPKPDGAENILLAIKQPEQIELSIPNSPDQAQDDEKSADEDDDDVDTDVVYQDADISLINSTEQGTKKKRGRESRTTKKSTRVSSRLSSRSQGRKGRTVETARTVEVVTSSPSSPAKARRGSNSKKREREEEEDQYSCRHSSRKSPRKSSKKKERGRKEKRGKSKNKGDESPPLAVEKKEEKEKQSVFKRLNIDVDRKPEVEMSVPIHIKTSTNGRTPKDDNGGQVLHYEMHQLQRGRLQIRASKPK